MFGNEAVASCFKLPLHLRGRIGVFAKI